RYRLDMAYEASSVYVIVTRAKFITRSREIALWIHIPRRQLFRLKLQLTPCQCTEAEHVNEQDYTLIATHNPHPKKMNEVKE
ncbi:hypothetical protein, partial [Xanthomonas hortorum]|uniref:hypothetical protein n=1 Tax=Xanthomonas hortorum TaxID=56454 RepID=UPI000D44225A